MARSKSQARAEKKRRYSSARERAEKKGMGYIPHYLKLPKGAKLFKPKAGTMTIDILPFEVKEETEFAEPGMLHWERTYYAHRGVGANSDAELCLKKAGGKGKCPICEHRAKLDAQGDADNEELIKDLAPKQRQLFNVIDLKNPDAGVQIWDISYHLFGKQLDAEIRNSEEDDEFDQFFFLSGGFTLRVTMVEKTFGGRTYLEAETISFRRRREDYEEDILEKVYCLDDVLEAKSYDDLKASFLETDEDKPKKGKGKKAAEEPDDEDDDDEDEEEAPPPKKGKSAKGKKAPPPEEDDDDDEDWDEDDGDDDDADDEDQDDKDEDDEDDDPPPSKKPGKAKPAKGKKAPPPDEDEDDEEDDWDEDDDDAEDQPPPKRGKGKKAPPAEEDDDDDDDDWDDDDEEDSQPEKPAKSGKKTTRRRK